MAIKTSKNKEAYYARYASAKLQASNRKEKLLRLQKEQPNNKQIESALLDIHYRRHTPKVPYWSHSMIATAKLVKKFTGKFDKGIFSSDIKVNSAAIRTRNEEVFKQFKMPTMNKDSQFSIKERAHSQNGMRVWL
jgi:hypothetical protein